MISTQQKILDFLNQHDDCVMATTNEQGQAEAAVVGYSANSQLELTVGTSKKTRKYQNILHEPHVAIVVGFNGEITVQYEGFARELGGEELRERQRLHFEKIPSVEHFKNDPDQVYFSISPTWVRYTDYTQEPATEELRQFV